ncbi:hypothetical protein LZC95_13600 [Pendulispora brunnea]|uniref:Uncharacterized protein n=1 Tax=Pendulispora brunnea TaxID=2905690 RepID=A0ABZ2KGR4_9BACT
MGHGWMLHAAMRGVPLALLVLLLAGCRSSKKPVEGAPAEASAAPVASAPSDVSAEPCRAPEPPAPSNAARVGTFGHPAIGNVFGPHSAGDARIVAIDRDQVLIVDLHGGGTTFVDLAKKQQRHPTTQRIWHDVRVSPDGKTLLGIDGANAELFDVKTNRVSAIPNPENSVCAVDFAETADTLLRACVSQGSTTAHVERCNGVGTSCRALLEIPILGQAPALRSFPRGQRFAIGTRSGTSIHDSKTGARVWNRDFPKDSTNDHRDLLRAGGGKGKEWTLWSLGTKQASEGGAPEATLAMVDARGAKILPALNLTSFDRATIANDGRSLFVAHPKGPHEREHTLHSIDLQSGVDRPVKGLAQHAASIAFLDDGSAIWVADGHSHVWIYRAPVEQALGENSPVFYPSLGKLAPGMFSSNGRLAYSGKHIFSTDGAAVPAPWVSECDFSVNLVSRDNLFFLEQCENGNGPTRRIRAGRFEGGAAVEAFSAVGEFRAKMYAGLRTTWLALREHNRALDGTAPPRRTLVDLRTGASRAILVGVKRAGRPSEPWESLFYGLDSAGVSETAAHIAHTSHFTTDSEGQSSREREKLWTIAVRSEDEEEHSVSGTAKANTWQGPASVSEDAKRAAVFNVEEHEYSIQPYELPSLEPRRSCSEQADEADFVALGADYALVAVRSKSRVASKELHVWRLRDCAVRAIPLGLPSSPTFGVVTTDQRHAVLISEDFSASVWDLDRLFE